MPSGPRPQMPQWGGPCYDARCTQFRAQVEAGVANAQAQWDYAAETERSQQIVSEQRAAMETQMQEQAKVTAEYQKVLEQTQQQVGLVKKQATASIAQQRSQSNLAAAQARQETQKFASAQQPQESRKAGQAVGQPGVSRTRISSRIGIGGYSGTAPGRVNPTGLNI